MSYTTVIKLTKTIHNLTETITILARTKLTLFILDFSLDIFNSVRRLNLNKTAR